MPSSPPTRAALGRAVRDLRQARGLTIEALAGEADMHPTYLSGIERGRYNPSYTKLGGLAQALDLEMSELLAQAEKTRDRIS